MEKPIAIFGFGRSGTTWLSDIISKSLGEIILFEPFHPSVWNQAESNCYRTNNDLDYHQKYQTHLDACYSKQIKNPWLLRNHVGVNPLEFSESFINMVWSNSKISGFKTIRGNHLMSHFEMDHNCIYIVRHPLSVLASILKRPRFFEEFGWNFHRQEFFKRAIKHQVFNHESLPNMDGLSKTEIIAAMWTISTIIAFEDIEKYNIPFVYYEDLYTKPYDETKELLINLGYENKNLHPSYLFTPSMLTLKTAHNFDKKGDEFVNAGPKAFWKDTFSEREEMKLIDFIRSTVSPFKMARKKLERYFVV